MVLSATKRVSATASITNQNSQGGSKKAGLPHHVGKDAYAAIHIGGGSALGVRFASVGLKRISITANPNVKHSRPIGISPIVWH